MIKIFTSIFLLFSVLLNAQNWYTFAGSNQKNGLTKLTGPSSVSSQYWSVASSNNTVWGNAVYTFGDKFVTSRVILSPYMGKVELRSLVTGSLIWEKTVSDTARMYAVGFTEDAVYACDYKVGRLYALTVDSGNVKWSIASDMFPGNTGICFAPDGDPIIFGKRLDRKTGVPKWSNNYIIPVGPDGGFVVYGNTYYHWTGSIVTPKKLIAIDINSGSTKYMSDALPGDGDQENDLVIGPDGTIYISRDGGALHAFTDNGSGFTQKWTLSPAVLVKSFGPDNVIYCANVNYGSTNGKLMRVNGTSGTVIDSVSSSIPGVYVTVGYDSTVYVSTGEAANGRYFAFSPDLQTTKWQLSVPYNYYTGCPLGKEGVFVSAGSGTQITAYKPGITRKPVADFRSSGRDISTAQSISFYDQSSYLPTSWNWTFTGGTPSTSTVQNPAGITYSSPGIYEVKLVAANSFGSDTIVKTQYVFVAQSSGISGTEQLPDKFILCQNYPNPFNPNTTIKFSIPGNGLVSLFVYDVTGKKVSGILNNVKYSSGSHSAVFSSENIPSGIYFYSLYFDGIIVDTKKMIVIK
ncbi:MAG: PKD domain-containing protein [Ignavibacteriae bacterium]|nr:PKD domain-containing protein [Ignavibacteriota bacterium]